MGMWICLRKVKRIRPFVNYYHSKPTKICSTDNRELHIGFLKRMLEIGYLEIKDAPDGG